MKQTLLFLLPLLSSYGQTAIFEADFDSSTALTGALSANATDTNLNAGTAVGSWSSVGGSEPGAVIANAAGNNNAFVFDQNVGSVSDLSQGNFASPVNLSSGEGLVFSFDVYASRQGNGNREVRISLDDATGAKAYTIIFDLDNVKNFDWVDANGVVNGGGENGNGVGGLANSNNVNNGFENPILDGFLGWNSGSQVRVTITIPASADNSTSAANAQAFVTIDWDRNGLIEANEGDVANVSFGPSDLTVSELSGFEIFYGGGNTRGAWFDNFSATALPAPPPVAPNPEITLAASSLGAAGGNLGQNIVIDNLRIESDSSTELYLGSTTSGSSSLGVLGGFQEETVNAGEALYFNFTDPAQIDLLTLAGVDVGDGAILISGFTENPGAFFSNGLATFQNGLLTLTPTSAADLTTVSFSNPQSLKRLIIASPSAQAGAGGIGLHELGFTPQPRRLYRELFPNGVRSERDIATAGWDGAAAVGGSSSINPTIESSQNTVNTVSLGAGNLGTSASAGGLTFTAENGDLLSAPLNGFDSLGVEGTTDPGLASFRGNENIIVTPSSEGLALRSVNLVVAGADDSPVNISGFLTEPIASLSNGTVSFAGDTLTLTFTSFANNPILTISNDAVASRLTFNAQGLDSANGVGLRSITFSEASDLPAFSEDATIAGVIGNDYAIIRDLRGDESLKAIVTTESDRVDAAFNDFSLLRIKWDQAGALQGDNISVRPLIEVGGQWFASATSFTTSGSDESLTPTQLDITTTAAEWLEVTLEAGFATLGAPPTSALSGSITNIGLLADFSSDNEDQEIWFDNVELGGILLDGVSIPWTFVSMPDYTNSDIADLSGEVTGVPPSSTWDGGQNGTAFELEDGLAGLLDSLASENPDFMMIAGDSLEGEWFRTNGNRFLFGPQSNAAQRELAWVEGSFYYYGHLVNEWLTSRDLEPIICIGDHEYGDNDWPVGGVNTALIPLMRSEFGRWITRFPRGRWDALTSAGGPDITAPTFLEANAPFLWPLRPVGTQYEETAYAFRNRDTLIVNIDVFYHDLNEEPTFHYPFGNTVTATLGPTTDTQYPATPDLGQFAWLQDVLADGRADPAINHIIVQGHTPILHPVVNTGSSGMTFRDGETSGVWQEFIANDVDLYFCGETHDVAASRDNGVQQINHGSPAIGRLLNYGVGVVADDRIEFTLKTGRLTRNNSVPIWIPQNGNNQSGVGNLTIPFTVNDQIVIDKSGSEDVLTGGSALLSEIEDTDFLVYYPFDETAGERFMSNQGSLPDFASGGGRRWRGALDPDWLSPIDFSAGKLGNSLTFAGVQGNPDALLSGDCPAPIGKPRTMSFWMRTSSDGFMHIAGFGARTNARPTANFTVMKDANNILRLSIGTPNGNDLATTAFGSPALNDGEWHHCGIVVPAWNSRLNEVRFFVDGVFYPTSPGTSDETIVTASSSFTGQLRLGRASDDGNNTPYVGELDDFAIWGRALSDAEMRVFFEFCNSPFAYDTGQIDQILKAFRAQENVTIAGTTWFYLGEDLRGSTGALNELNSGFQTLPLEPSIGFSTTPNLFESKLSLEEIQLNEGRDMVSLTWDSLADATYTIRATTDLALPISQWTIVGQNIPATGTLTTLDVVNAPASSFRFFVVEEVPN